MLSDDMIETIIQDRLDDLFTSAKKEFPMCEITLENEFNELNLNKLYVKVDRKPPEDNLADYTREDLIEICKEQLLEFYRFISEIKAGKYPYELETKCYNLMSPLKGIRSCLWNKDKKWTVEYEKIIKGRK